VRLEPQRQAVAAACRQLAAEGLVIGTSGNVSAAGEDDLIAITPTGAVLADLEPGDVAVVDRSGALVDGPLAPTSELDLHLGIYERHGAGAVVHTHAPMATALSCVIDELPCVHYSMLLLGGTVPVAPYETFGTPKLAEAVVESLVGHTAALMANHGAVTFAEDVPAAVERMSLLEWASTVYWRARALGEPNVLDEEARAAVVSAAIERGYGETKPVTAEGDG
jgi:L-fuculose-phosphate aldolase